MLPFWLCFFFKQSSSSSDLNDMKIFCYIFNSYPTFGAEVPFSLLPTPKSQDSI